MKKFVSLFLTTLLLCGAAAVADEMVFADGVYTSVMQTAESQMTVTVTLDENLIKGVSLTADESEINVSDPEITGVLQAIVAGQTLAVDLQNVKCADVCQTILSGVEHCVKQAGGDPEVLRTHHLCQSQHGYHQVSGCPSHSSGSHHQSSSHHSSSPSSQKSSHHSQSSGSSHSNKGGSHHGGGHH